MAEAEELVAEGALLATRVAQELWKRSSPAPELARLVDVQERIERFVTGIRGACPRLMIANPPLQRSLFGRLALRIPAHLNSAHVLPGTDGQHILLPRGIAKTAQDPSGIRRYRLFALIQAARIERLARLKVPTDPVARALFIALDGSATLRALGFDLPCLRSDIASSVERSISLRPPLGALNDLERAVEGVIRQSLQNSLLTEPDRVGDAEHQLVERLEQRTADQRARFTGRYRGLPGVECWGELESERSLSSLGKRTTADDAARKSPPKVTHLQRRPTLRSAAPDEDDHRPGMFIIKPDASQQSAEDPLGLVRPLDRGDVDSAELSAALSELSEARVVQVPGAVREILLSETAIPARTAWVSPPAADGQRFLYPEWDCRTSSYRECHAVVRELEAARGDSGWAAGVLRRHAHLVDTVCASFASLRPNRSRLRRQSDGSEVDLDACVAAFADRRAGSPADEGLYEDLRPRQRDLAIMVMIDSSASTDSSIRGRERIIDLEKEALLVVCKALEQLADRYAAYGFSGESVNNVRVLPLKRFDERYDARVEARIAGLEPDRYTRLGAALRHATAHLAREQAQHRLLLLVSDGKPNDSDEYEGRYGIEDTRQAIIEARMQNLQPFCLTVDRDAPGYARHVFGPTGYTVLREAQLLPRVLLQVLRRLVVR
jgi:nitric oxide reductase NorD protein